MNLAQAVAQVFGNLVPARLWDLSLSSNEEAASDPDALIIFRANPVHAARTLFRLDELGCNHNRSTAGTQLAGELACPITEAGASCLTNLFLCHLKSSFSNNFNECQA
jgi:hypothetical protein